MNQSPGPLVWLFVPLGKATFDPEADLSMSLELHGRPLPHVWLVQILQIQFENLEMRVDVPALCLRRFA